MRPPIRPRVDVPAPAPAPEPPAPAVAAEPQTAPEPTIDWQASAAQTLAAAKARLAVLRPEVTRLEKLIAALET